VKNLIRKIFSNPFQFLLVFSFSVIATLAIAIGTWTISRTISDYLAVAMDERIDRDMHLAQVFYDLKLHEIEGVAERLSTDPLIMGQVQKSLAGDPFSSELIIRQIRSNVSQSDMGRNHLILILDRDGNLLAGDRRLTNRLGATFGPEQNWGSLGIIDESVSSERSITATEIIPASLLVKAGLSEQASITILDTPKASPELFDPRELTDGLALFSVSPVKSDSGQVLGSAVALHLLNNDFTLVDKIKEVAEVDNVTIFLGDLRVSTNVMTRAGGRAIGTRVSDEVSQVVLHGGGIFVGPAFVVYEEQITRYDPIRDHSGQIIGILYVGTKQASFQRLVNMFNQRITMVAFGTVLLTILLATPVSRLITRPLNQVKVLVEANQRVAKGDMSVRVLVQDSGEIGLLETSFNSMLDTLQSTQDQLVQSEKLASIGQLAAGVAHELNNPLGTILLFSDILLRETPHDSSQREDLDVIVNETKRCKGIVSALLEFARQHQVVTEPTDLNSLIQDVIEVEWKHLETEPVIFETELDWDIPKIQVDPSQMQQILFNLIENSVQAMPDGGRITLRTRNEPANMVTLEVEDTGIGIQPEHLTMLFTPFFTTKPIGIGTGMGLAIVYGIIKLHRGQITVRSTVGVGTTFVIQLPIKHQPPKHSGNISVVLES
jgi:two-component system, NtrC family, sensor kinase